MPIRAAALALLPVLATFEDGWDQDRLEAVTDEIRAELEEIRGASFVRPVRVRITDGAGFLAHAKERVAALTTPEEWAAEEALAKHLGLIPADYDLLAETYEVLESQVGGFYDPAADTFYLMEGFDGGLAKVILSHELTHALDDQLFDLDAGMRSRVDSKDALFAYQALAEGSAQLAMTRWVMGHIGVLTPDDLEQASVGTEELAGAPRYVWKPLIAAYLAGNAFLDRGFRIHRREKGSEATRGATVDAAFAAPPLSSEQVLHPEKYWQPAERDDPTRVLHGAVPEGWTESMRTTLGELVLAIVVDESEPPDLSNQMALLKMKYTSDAASGWDGDEALLLERDGATAVHLATVWDTEGDADEFAAALEASRPRLETALAELSDSYAWLVERGERAGVPSVVLVAATGIGPDAARELDLALDWTAQPPPERPAEGASESDSGDATGDR